MLKRCAPRRCWLIQQWQGDAPLGGQAKGYLIFIQVRCTPAAA